MLKSIKLKAYFRFKCLLAPPRQAEGKGGAKRKPIPLLALHGLSFGEIANPIFQKQKKRGLTSLLLFNYRLIFHAVDANFKRTLKPYVADIIALV